MRGLITIVSDESGVVAGGEEDFRGGKGTQCGDPASVLVAMVDQLACGKRALVDEELVRTSPLPVS